MHIFVRRGGPNYQTGLAKMRALGEELGIPLEVRDQYVSINYAIRLKMFLNSVKLLPDLQVYGPEATMTGICKQAIDCIMSAS